MKKTISKVLITGGNGFIGSHLAEKLLSSGEAVTLFDLKFDQNTRSVNVEKIHGDVTEYQTVRKAIAGKDAVIHLAAVSRVVWGQQDPFKCWLTNQIGTVNVLEGCRKAHLEPFLLEASSREVYGEPLYLPVNEEHPKRPKSVYGLTKLSAERACQSYSARSGLDRPVKHAIMRFSNVYGSERDLPDRVIPKFVRKAVRGEDITLYGGEQILDFTFIDDTVAGIMKTYEACANGGDDVFYEDFHFVTGRGLSVAELAKLIVNILGSRSRILDAPANSFDVRKFVGDPSKAQTILGYESGIKLEEGLKRLSERMMPMIIAR